MISVNIVPTGSSVALRDYSLTCSNDATNNLELILISYEWTRNGITLSHNDRVLNLSPLQESENNVMYRCRFSASSTYLINDVNIQSSQHTITVSCKFYKIKELF